MNPDELAMAIDELADDTAMYLYRVLGLEYDTADMEVAALVRKQISSTLDWCASGIRVLENVQSETVPKD